MKPIKLTLSAWGPYRECCEIDFEKLTNKSLFLITGQTGAGKTTVFDAITYALYGAMSGGMREKNSVRSDFAPADVPTFVRLLMEHGGKRYEIERNPEYLRPKKRKAGENEWTKEKERAVLKLPDGSVLEGNVEVNRKLQEILVLDYRQFKQISMIAQGEFARFLTAPSAEKTKIFREIFDTEIYNRVAENLKEKAKAAYAKVSEYRHRMEENINTCRDEDQRWQEAVRESKGNFHFEYLKQLSEQLSLEYRRKASDMEKEWKATDEKLAVKKEELAGILQDNKNLELLAQIKEKLLQVKQQEPAAQAHEKEKEEAARAAQVYPEMLVRDHAGTQAQQRREKLEEVKARREELLKEKEGLSGFAALEEQVLKAYEVAQLSEQLEEKKTALAEKEKRARIFWEKAADDYKKAERESGKALEISEEKKKRYRADAIGLVAGMLKEGTPCPVCGSLSHPEPAHQTGETPREEEVKEAEKVYQKAQERAATAFGNAQAAKKSLEIILEEKKTLKEEKTAAQEKIESFSEEVLALVKPPYAENSRMYQKLTERFRQLEALLEAQAQNEEAACRELSESLDKLQKAEAKLKEVLQENGFQSEEEYRGALRDEKRRKEIEEKLQKFYLIKQRAQERCAELTELTQGKQYTDPRPLEESCKKLQEEREEVQKQYQHMALKEKMTGATALALKENLQAEKEAAAQYGLVKKLEDAATGNNPKRLVFEQYVLAGYFEDILRAANIRLAKMSGGRYELSRALQVADGRSKDNLEMEVMDYYTGKCRSVKTLSGGETFKVSLSLALGMSDVIQAGSGGIRVEALFIDEGFGALDQESLDQACSTLTSLVEQDRMIGIISHVPELKERISSQIVIVKGNNGSSIKIQ